MCTRDVLHLRTPLSWEHAFAYERAFSRNLGWVTPAEQQRLDFFAYEARQMVFAECAARGIPAITAAQLGMGASVLNFMPGGMSFDDYFGWTAHMDDKEKALRFALGVAPAGLHRGYLVHTDGPGLHQAPRPVDVDVLPDRRGYGRDRGAQDRVAARPCARRAARSPLRRLPGANGSYVAALGQPASVAAAGTGVRAEVSRQALDAGLTRGRQATAEPRGGADCPLLVLGLAPIPIR